MIEIDATLSIPEHELTFATSRSGGPGGQHVNKVSTRVTLYFDVARSPSLDDERRGRILRRLATRISKEGVLRVVCQQHRSQAANREEAVARFVELLREALARRTPRRATKVPRGEKRRRVEDKRRRKSVKQGRGRVASDE
jgi:ribosome-associated protein